jgi:hypothetical protein
MEFTLEWMLPSPVPMHVFDQPPIVVEVKNRYVLPPPPRSNGACSLVGTAETPILRRCTEHVRVTSEQAVLH